MGAGKGLRWPPVWERQMQTLLQQCYTVSAGDAIEDIIRDVQRRVRQRIHWIVRSGLRFNGAWKVETECTVRCHFSGYDFDLQHLEFLNQRLIYKEPSTLLQAATGSRPSHLSSRTQL